MDPNGRDPRTYAIIGAAMQVHRDLGPGFLESIYHNCYGNVVVEIKSQLGLGRADVAQLANYLAVTRQPLGVLLNFGTTMLEYRRVIGRHAQNSRPEQDLDPCPGPEPESVGFSKTNVPQADLGSASSVGPPKPPGEPTG